MKRRRLLAYMLVMILALSCLAGCGQSGSETNDQGKASPDLEEIASHIDVDKIIQNTDEISQIGSTEDGFCICGSPADAEEADRLQEMMKEAGMTDVREDVFTCDGWDYSKLTLKVTEPEEKELEVGPFAGSIGTDGKDLNAEVVYVGYGTHDELVDADVKGKIVLAEFDLLYDYWPSMPVEEAHKLGAVGMIQFYSDTNPIYDDVRGSFDTQSELYMPIVNVSKNTGKYLKDLCSKATTKVTLNSDAKVTPGVESCNVVGYIKGKNPDKYIVLGGHRDHFYKPFSDDTLGVTTVIGVGKALVDAGYEPNCTLVFVAYGAEEYGVACQRYDWAYGSYQFIKNNPDIIDNTILCINLDNYLSDHDATTYNFRPDTSLMTYAKNSIEEIGGVPEIFTDGAVFLEGAYSFQDSYGFNTVAGIPSIEAVKRPFPEGENSNYHTLMDSTEYYTGKEEDKALTSETIEYTVKTYIKWVLDFDQMSVTAFDYGHDMELLLEAMDTKVMDQFGIDYKEAKDAAEKVKTTGAEYYKLLAQINEKAKANPEAAEKLQAEFDKINDATYELYGEIEKSFYCLDIWDGNCMPEDKILGNLTHLNAAKEALEADDSKGALEELDSVDISYYFGMFDKDVIQKWYFDALDSSKYEQYWAKDMTIRHVDCYDLYNKLSDGNYNKDECVAELQKLIDEQVSNCNDYVSRQKAAIDHAAELLDVSALESLLEKL